ncbi:acyltransferase family protein [Brachybacterium sp. FME24]|uniref:acyltransferase family protein n=1 Tax=Brachybacterium sp. FME24 TaxID=2742605 RepID=UPI0018694234|nr:acyltransferase family protein [Brachybacterium sp. FME24]
MSTSPAPSRANAAAAPSTHAGRFRPELHGLRGLAIGLVVLYHVWFDRVSGGVDVFLFISSFLLVGTFLRRIDQGVPTRPLAYWARTFKRLLPPTAVVALATLGGVYLLLPADRWMPAITDAAGSLLHIENWVLIQRGVDYYAADDSVASAFQHFWSLSIQGQVFLLWPLVIAASVLIARWLRRPARMVLAIVFALVLLASFAWSVYSTATQQEIAYFDTFARLWEFAAGSLLGLLLPVWEARRDGRISRSGPAGSMPRMAVGWVGILALIACGLLIDVQGAFPGWIAAWPLLAAALVLIAGTTGHRFGVDRLLSTAPARLLGDISYGLYLVHWPLLALYLAATGKARAGALDGLVLILLSLLLAYLLTRLVDSPIRRWPWAGEKAWRGGLVAVSCLVLGLAPVFGAQQYLLGAQREAEARAVADNPGARVLDPDYTVHPEADPDAAVLPTAALISKDWVSGSEACTDELAPQDAETEQLEPICRVIPGDPGKPVIVSVGDSRMEQLSGALIPLAQREGWTLVTIWKGGCTYAPDQELSPDCDAFGDAADAYLQRVQPEVVAATTTAFGRDGAETVPDGMESTLGDLTASGSTIIAMRALPRLQIDPPVCVEETGQDASECAPPLPEPLTQERPDAEILAATDGEVHAVDPNPLMCPDGVCAPVIGNVMVSLDRDHLTGTYAESMQGGIDAQLAESGFRW